MESELHVYCTACCRAYEEYNSVKYCIDCEEGLCEQCCRAHTRNKLTLCHSFIDISLVSSLRASLVHSGQVCNKHTNFKLDLVCTVHDTLCCRQCMLENHRQCNLVLPIETAANKIKENCESECLAKESKKIHQNTGRIVEVGHRNIQNVQIQKEQILKSISAVRFKFLQASDNIEEKLATNLKQSFDFNVESIKKYRAETTEMRDIALVYRQEIDFIRSHASENKAFLLIERLKKDLLKDKAKMKSIVENVKNVKLLYADTSDFEVKSVGKIVVVNGPCPIKYTICEVLSGIFKYEGEIDLQIETKINQEDGDMFEEGCLYEDIEEAARGITHSGEPSYVTSAGPYVTLSAKDICLEHKIHAGKFTEVWIGSLRKNYKVVVKRIIRGGQDVRLELLTETSHENIIKFHGAFVEKSIQCLVFEFMSSLDLIQYLNTIEGQKLHGVELLSIASQIARGMAYLESKHIVHAKFQAKRVMTGENREVKISGLEYGTVQKVETLYDYTPMNSDELSFKKNEYITVVDREDMNWWEGEINGQRGFFPKNYTTQPHQYVEMDENMNIWYALETFQDGYCDTKSNIWSFGIIMIEILTHGKRPYPDLQEYELQAKLEDGSRHPKPNGCSDDLYDVIMSCWNKRPEQRPTFDFLYNFIEDLIYDF